MPLATRLAPAALGLALALTLPTSGTLHAEAPPVWQEVTPAGLADPNTRLNGVDYGNGVFVAVGYFYVPGTVTNHNVSFTSADGASWTQHDLNFPTSGRVRFAHGRFYLFGSAPTQKIFSSTDGVTWTSVNDPESEGFAVGIAEGNGVTVAARGAGLSGIEAAVTTDGVNFTASHLPVSSIFTALTGIAFGAGQFAIVGAGIQGPFYFTSPDGGTWTAQPGLDYRNGYSFITYGNGRFLAQENGASQHVSTDALTWTVPSPGYRHDIPGIGTINQALRFARFLNGQFVAITVNDSLAASPDAANWTDLATVAGNGTTDQLKDVAFGAGQYVTVADKHIYRGAGGTNGTGGGSTHPAFFGGESALDKGAYFLRFPSGNAFGYYSYLSDAHYIYHFDLGYEYVFDANDGKGGAYLYDFKSGGFFYTSPSFPFPYLYDFSLKTALYYYPDPKNEGRYNTDGVRYFYRFDTGAIFSK